MQSGAQRVIMSGKKQPGLGRHRHTAQGEGFPRCLGLFSVTAYRLGCRQGKTPMQPCTQPGYHAMQKAAGLVAALAHGTRGGFLRCLGLLSGTAYRLRWTRGGPDAVRRTAGHHAGQRKIPRHGRGIVSVIGGAGDQRNWVPLISSLKERSRYSAARLESIMRVRKISK